DTYNVRALNSLGSLYFNMQKYKEAENFFGNAAKIDVNNTVADYFMKLLKGEQVDIAPKEYIERLFDSYSATFDKHLTDVLEYKTPDSIADIFNTLNFPKNLLEIKVLDLGCGTGMVAEKIVNKIANNQLPIQFYGIDLSERMLEIAKSRKIYSKLRLSSIEDFFKTNKKQFNCVIAADVFVYIGDLEDIFKSTHNVLKDSGSFIFSIERLDNESNFKLIKESARYSHSEQYIRLLANNFGFKIDSIIHTNLRKEKGEIIPGLLVHLVK
ncbi:MAG: methyltransferase domain-containing protein, partial [Alphaproteobacteria bacterium]|nr:methyltransferase domain-containing protein [Alphaproteobacteria bacterium]